MASEARLPEDCESIFCQGRCAVEDKAALITASLGRATLAARRARRTAARSSESYKKEVFGAYREEMFWGVLRPQAGGPRGIQFKPTNPDQTRESNRETCPSTAAGAVPEHRECAR